MRIIRVTVEIEVDDTSESNIDFDNYVQVAEWIEHHLEDDIYGITSVNSANVLDISIID